MIVDLDDGEMRRLAYAGVDRRIDALSKKRKGAHGFDREFEAWQIDIEGILAEGVVAKALGVYFAPVTGSLDTALGDVAPGVQVRSTRYGFDRKDVGCLLLHDSDADADRFILVCGAAPRYRIAGWLRAEHGKLDKFKRQHKGRWAYWVPQDQLRSWDEFIL